MTATVTLQDLCNHLERAEETMLVELLNLRSEDIVERFRDVIEENYDRLLGEIEILSDPSENYDEESGVLESEDEDMEELWDERN